MYKKKTNKKHVCHTPSVLEILRPNVLGRGNPKDGMLCPLTQ